jgi:uncharacterized membrane protein
MTRTEMTFGAAGVVLALLAGLLTEGSVQSLVLAIVILAFAMGRNRARKDEERGFGRYFGEVLAYGAVIGLAAMVGAFVRAAT